MKVDIIFLILHFDYFYIIYIITTEYFISNVFEQLCTEAFEVSQNQTVSKIIESLVAKATNGQARMLLEALSSDWKQVVTDRLILFWYNLLCYCKNIFIIL